MKFTLKEIFSPINEDHLKSRESKIKYIIDNQESNIAGYPFIEDDLSVLSDERLDIIYQNLEAKVDAKEKSGTVSESSSPKLDRMNQLIKSFSERGAVIKEEKEKLINEDALNEEAERLKKLSNHRLDEYGNDSVRQSGMRYGGGYNQTVNTFLDQNSDVKKYSSISSAELTEEEALGIAVRRVLSSGTPVNNMSFYDEINWNLNQLGFDSKLPLDIKNAMRKLAGGEIDTKVD